MRFVDEFRDGGLAAGIAAAIAREARPARDYRFMEFCGGHTHTLARHGIAQLLPPNLRMIHGPGCPVCVLPIGRIDQAIGLASRDRVILCSYGDTLRVPGSNGTSLLRARARGADMRMVYTCADALRIARDNPQREVVFFAIGFETTTPPTALAIVEAAERGLRNFSVLCCHVLTPPAIAGILGARVPDEAPARIDGLVGPAHVSAVIGTRPYERFARDDGMPVVVAGFEPLDVMQAILMLVRQVNAGRHEVENEFTRVVSREGNLLAQHRIAQVFETREAFEWRGLGELPRSALRIREPYGALDAERRFDLAYRAVVDHKACECAAVLRGAKHPSQCKLFGTACTPDTPMGACMVSSEGACAAHYTYGRHRDAALA